MQYFDIYLDSIKGLYTYADKNDEFQLGDNVIVPFRNIKKSGFIIRKNLNENFDFKVMNIASKVENSIKLSTEQLQLIEWIVEYYVASYDSVIKAMLPKKVKIEYSNIYYLNLDNLNLIKEKIAEENKILNYIFSGANISFSSAKSKFKKSVIDKLVNKNILKNEDNRIFLVPDKILELKNEKEEIFTYFYDKMSIKKKKLQEHFSSSEIIALQNEKILTVEASLSKKKEYFSETVDRVSKNKSILNEQQLKVKDEIENSENKYFLLKGVTGSGKTEIYIELVKSAFFEGYGSIFLVPEISLTPQMINRFQEEFKNNIAILHSGL